MKYEVHFGVNDQQIHSKETNFEGILECFEGYIRQLKNTQKKPDKIVFGAISLKLRNRILTGEEKE